MIGTGLAFMPEQFMALTLGQRDAAINEANKANQR